MSLTTQRPAPESHNICLGLLPFAPADAVRLSALKGATTGMDLHDALKVRSHRSGIEGVVMLGLLNLAHLRLALIFGSNSGLDVDRSNFLLCSVPNLGYRPWLRSSRALCGE